jgi:hypothetical protein
VDIDIRRFCNGHPIHFLKTAINSENKKIQGLSAALAASAAHLNDLFHSSLIGYPSARF